MNKIIVAGSSNIDFVLRVAEMPKKGETIRTRSFDKIPGGKGANQACAVGKLGGDCVFLSAVGEDGLGSIVTDSLAAAGVDLSRVLRDKETPTGMAVIAVNDEGENSIMIVPGANGLCTEDYFDRNADCLAPGDILLAQLETPIEAIWKLIEKAKAAGCTTILNPAPAPESIPDAVLAAVDYITPNETELAAITGLPTGTVEEIDAAARSLCARGAGRVLVTIGPRGALLCDESGSRVYPTFDAKRVDTTAAGDTFNAGLAVSLAEGASLEEAIRLANAAAAISITRKGAQTSIPSRAEVDQLLQSAQEG